MSTIEEITAKFPIKSISSIVVDPTYETIHQLVNDLYANAAAIPSLLGGGRHGHVGILMSATLYATLSNSPYIIPIDPGPIPVYPRVNITLVALQAATDAHKVLKLTFLVYIVL